MDSSHIIRIIPLLITPIDPIALLMYTRTSASISISSEQVVICKARVANAMGGCFGPEKRQKLCKETTGPRMNWTRTHLADGTMETSCSAMVMPVCATPIGTV